MSEARALTNLIGNGVATVVVAKWDRRRSTPTACTAHLNNETDAEAERAGERCSIDGRGQPRDRPAVTAQEPEPPERQAMSQETVR